MTRRFDLARGAMPFGFRRHDVDRLELAAAQHGQRHRALEAMIGAPVHPLRFRANLYVAGWPAWAELDLVGRDVAVGPTARLKVVKRIVRCAATNVDPDTGIRDLTIPDTLMQNLGHTDCGVYGEVIDGGTIATGDEVNMP